MNEHDAQIVRIHQLLELNRLGEAAEAARSVLAQSPDHHDAHMLLTYALVGMEQADVGLRVAESGCATFPNSHDMHLARARALDANNKVREAILAAEVATRIDPNSVGAWVGHAQYLVSFASEMHGTSTTKTEVLDAAAQSAARAQALNPMVAEPHFVRAKVHIVAKQYAEAEQAARVGLSIEPDTARGHQLLGVAQRLNKEKRAAGDSFVTAGRSDPSAGDSAELLGWAKFSDWQWVIVAVLLVIPLLSFLDGSYETWMGVLGALGFAGAAWLKWGRSNRLSDEAEAIRSRGRKRKRKPG